jgi:hypothetical protein
MLDILAEYFAAVVRHYFGDAWTSVAPNEPVIRTVSKHDPEETDFSEKQLPLLCVWREADVTPNKLGDLVGESQSQVRILWVPPPATQDKKHKRHSFFNAFDKAIRFAVQNGRDPSWVYPADVADPAPTGQALKVKTAAEYYGSDVYALAGISWWTLQNVNRVPVQVPTEQARLTYPAYLATLLVAETTDSDPVAFGGVPTEFEVALTSGGDDPITRFEAEVPPDEP